MCPEGELMLITSEPEREAKSWVASLVLGRPVRERVAVLPVGPGGAVKGRRRGCYERRDEPQPEIRRLSNRSGSPERRLAGEILGERRPEPVKETPDAAGSEGEGTGFAGTEVLPGRVPFLEGEVRAGAQAPAQAAPDAVAGASPRVSEIHPRSLR